MEPARVRALASHAIGLELLARAVAALRPRAIPVVPLKGLWLQSCVLVDPGARAITDVDVLVPEARFYEALWALRRAGFEARYGNASERALYHPSSPLPLDLHRRLFMPGAFDLPTSQVFLRAGRDLRRMGTEVWLPHPVDAVAHLVGHFVKSRGRPSDAARTADFVAVAEQGTHTPLEWAGRLEATGLARATRYAFAERRREHPFLDAVCRVLPLDPVGERIASLCAQLARDGPEGALGALPGFALERSIPKAFVSLLLRTHALGVARLQVDGTR